MRISKNTIEILKNFASINQNILIKEGSTLTTRSVVKTIYAEADVDTVFPKEFGIYNLNSFLGVLSLFSDPEVTLLDKSMTISQGNNRVQYNFAAPEVLDYPERAINMPQTDVTFTLSEENLKSILKAGAILSSTDLNITGDGTTVVCTALDPKNSAANTFSVDVGTTDRKFSAFIKLEMLKMPTGNYEVSLSSKKIAKFKNTGIDYSIYIANTPETTWETV